MTQKEVSGRGFSSVRGAVGAPGGAQVRLSNGSNDFKGNPPLRIQYFAYDALSELTHVAGSIPSTYATGAFSDYHLAKTAFDVVNEMGAPQSILRTGLTVTVTLKGIAAPRVLLRGRNTVTGNLLIERSSACAFRQCRRDHDS